jgi:2,3-bisphosphoglycerate-independent phosphoglycerate mutase
MLIVNCFIMTRPKPVVLAIVDGWGLAPPSEGNAIFIAKTPNINQMITNYPATALSAAGGEVGLYWGEMGNSEVGHLNIGAGRVYYQMGPRITKAISDGNFFSNPAFLGACEHIKETKGKMHLMGLVSPGGVHSHQDHLYALLKLAKEQGVRNVFVHAFLDGRDTIYNTGVGFIEDLQAKMKKIGVGKIATISGRYFAMDRDNHWDRVEKAYRAIAEGIGETATDPVEAIKSSYAKKIYDEEFVPMVIIKGKKPIATVSDGDAMICFNFREERAREITKAFVLPAFPKFPRRYIANLNFVMMSEYEKGLPGVIAYPPDIIHDCLAKAIADAGLRQLHIAETEKYAHVTFFINGQREAPFPGEERVIVPSPHVAKYDDRPEMSAYGITDRILKAIRENKYDFIVLNYANPDMVSHTGNLAATVRACEIVDECLGKLKEAIFARSGVLMITADHGNAEEMLNLQTGVVDKEHSTNAVPFIVVSKEYEGKSLNLPEGIGADLSLAAPAGMLADIAPTVLKIMGLPQPKEMTGRALI